MKKPYLIPIIAFCALVLLFIWAQYDDYISQKRDVAVKRIHVKLPSEEIKSRFQMAYDKACSDMLNRNYNEVKKYCFKVIKGNPHQMVSSGGTTFKVGPAALNMLAEVYASEKDYKAAMTSYQQMIDLFSQERFKTYQEGEDYWEGKAGAAGMLGQIKILTAHEKDLAQANNVLFHLMTAFNGQYPKRWEWKESYDSAGVRWITNYLEIKDASINEWETELNTIIQKTADNELKFDLKMTLARKYAAKKMIEQSANLYHQIIAEHAMEYWTSPEDGCFFYGMEAYQELIDFYQGLGRPDRASLEKQKMKVLYEKLILYVKAKKIELGAEALKGYKQYFE